MKTGIHPELHDTKVHCNGCGTDFVTHSTVDSIQVEICSNCHPFYTGKQKLIDTAGRVDKFRARQAAATKKAEAAAERQNARDKQLAEVQEKLEEQTVEEVQPETPEAVTEAAPEAEA